VIHLHKLAEGLDPFDRASAMNIVEQHRQSGQILTGLIYMEEHSEDLHKALDTVQRPLNQLGPEELCPGRKVLENINASLR
jgi:2-oxoglutarate ferredoxin oxidoreductase subunit beta